jgi:hypothetical protein
MDRQIAAEDLRYQNALAAIDPQLPQDDQERRKISLKNGNATKKSQIRKSFGVTLRMREKDRIASRTIAMVSSPAPMAASVAGPSSSGPSRLSPHVPSHVSTPSSGFSPINAPAPRHSPQVASGQPQSLHQSKRQRTSSFGEQATSPAVSDWTPPLSRTQTPYGPAPAGARLSTKELSSKDAASKHPKRVPVAAAQAKWEQLQPKRGATNGASGVDHSGFNTNGKRKASEEGIETTEGPATTTGSRTSSNSKQEPIEIDSSSDSEAGKTAPGDGKTPAPAGASNGNGVADKDKPLPSTEDIEAEVGSGASRRASSGNVRSGFMARRGGRRSLNS